MLIRLIKREMGDKIQVQECSQDSRGYCLAATGLWLCDPEKVQANITNEEFLSETKRIQEEYEKARESGVHSPNFLESKFPLKDMYLKKECALESKRLFEEIIFADTKPIRQGQLAIILGHNSGEAHYLGVRIENEIYKFFDVNECFCTMKNNEIFERFIEYYVTEQYLGLLRKGYIRFQVALYNCVL